MTIVTWKEEAYRRFPDLAQRFDDCECDTPYLLWFQLTSVFSEAYNDPRNEDMIKRIYGYSDWCFEQPSGESAEDDLLTCVAVCFIEHIPTIHLALQDMPRWWTRDEVLGTREILSYQVGEVGFNKILEVFEQYEKIEHDTQKRRPFLIELRFLKTRLLKDASI